MLVHCGCVLRDHSVESESATLTSADRARYQFKLYLISATNAPADCGRDADLAVPMRVAYQYATRGTGGFATR